MSKYYNKAVNVSKYKSIYCPYNLNVMYECYSHHCERCEIADRIRVERIINSEDLLMFTKSNCLRQTEKGGGQTFYKRPIVLSPEVMERLGIKVNLYNQLAYAYDGCGCFAFNPVGPIDCYLISDNKKQFTIQRHECYGVPNDEAMKRYDDYFMTDVRSLFRKDTRF